MIDQNKSNFDTFLILILILIREWLTGRSFYVQVGDHISALFGTIQGSVLGPVAFPRVTIPLASFKLTQI